MRAMMAIGIVPSAKPALRGLAQRDAQADVVQDDEQYRQAAQDIDGGIEVLARGEILVRNRFARNARRRRNLFAYIDVRDLGQMVQRCLEVDGLGYEVFNVANADMSVAATTQEIQDRFYDGVEVRREMGRDETFYAIDKVTNLHVGLLLNFGAEVMKELADMVVAAYAQSPAGQR